MFDELNDLKRVRSAGRDGSVATRLFRAAWGDLVCGRDAGGVADLTTAAALAAARLGDIDGAVLVSAGISGADATRILRRAIEEVAGRLDPVLVSRLLRSAGEGRGAAPGALPPFVAALEAQPRAGVTCPGRPRIVLEPPENHAEHCLVVAVYGVLLSPTYGADPATVFLAALSHHFHNAWMPDSGFTGEILLGDRLAAVMDHFTAEALASLAPRLRGAVRGARACLADAATPEGRAFHAADVIDRVLQIAQHLRAATLTMDVVLGELGLVHDGPVKPFHDRVLAEMRLP